METAYQALQHLKSARSEDHEKLSQVFNEALFQATAMSNVKLLERLVKAGLPLSVVDSPTTANTALHWAASFGSSEAVIDLLLEGGADVNAVNCEGATALHEAAYVKNRTIVELLLRKGAKDDVVAFKGKFKGKSPSELMEGFSTRILNGGSSVNYEAALNGHSNGIDDDSSLDSTAQSPAQDKSQEEDTFRKTSPERREPQISKKRMSLGSTSSAVTLPPPIIMDERFNLLWPQPKHLNQLPGDVCWFPPRITLAIASSETSVHKILDVWDSHANLLSSVGRKVHLSLNQPRGRGGGGGCQSSTAENQDGPQISCCVSRRTFISEEGYKITVNGGRVVLSAGGLGGLHNAIVTLVQLFRVFSNLKSPDKHPDKAAIVPVQISDFPDSPLRAVLLDLNPYGRVPKMDILFSFVESLCALKINQLHTFFRLSLKDESYLCYGKRDLLSLDRHCRDLSVDMVPAFDVDATVTTPEQLSLVGAKIRHLLSCFDRPKFINLGPAITSIVLSSNASSQGLSFESLVPCESVQDTTWVFCANSVALPGIKYSTNIPLNSIALHYGFQAEEQFGDTLGDYVSRGHDVGTCTGTCSWSTLTGSPELAMSNGHSAARASHRLGPLTLSVTSHWSSHPSLGHLTFALPGFLIGAGHSWNSTTPMTYVDTVLSDLVDAHLLGEWANLQPPGEGPSTSSVGKVLVDLGRAESWLNTSAANSTPTPSSSVLLSVLSDPDGLFDLVKSGLDPNEWNEAIKRIKKCQASLLKCPTPTSPTTENFRHEVFLSSELLLLAARLGRSLVVEASNKGQTSVPISALTSTFRTDIANKILGLAEQFKALWLSQCEPSGLQGALQVLTNLINALIPTTKGMPPAV